MNGDVTKLPRWVRDKIFVLEKEVNGLRHDLAAATGETETRVEVEPYATMLSRPRRFLPDRATVRFYLPGGWLDVRLDGDAILVTGSERVRVLPAASNAFRADV